MDLQISEALLAPYRLYQRKMLKKKTVFLYCSTKILPCLKIQEGVKNSKDLFLWAFIDLKNKAKNFLPILATKLTAVGYDLPPVFHLATVCSQEVLSQISAMA